MNFELRQGGNQLNRYMTEVSDRCQRRRNLKGEGYKPI